MKAGEIIEKKYRIEALLGEGGMGRVLAATHLTLNSTVAIKILKKDALSHPEVPRRFMREARSASRLRNEHVARVSDVGQLASGEPYMVMEMLHGYDLATRLKQGALDVPRAVEYIVQACEGLAEAHGQGMFHRDVKPANLFVTTRPNGAPLIKVLDFGIATAAIGDEDHGLTSTQSVIGSPSYMSPEQLRATRDVDQRSDIWSLGVTLYELLSDRQPFIAPTITALSLKIVSEPHVPIEGIPLELMAILDKCLEKDREQRFENVAELAEALAPHCPNGKLAAEMVLGSLSQAVPPTLNDISDVDARPAIDTQDPASAGWRMPSAPNMSLTTNGLAAGESAALRPARRRKTWMIALGSALAAGIATAAVIKTTATPPAPAVVAPPPQAAQPPSPPPTPAPAPVEVKPPEPPPVETKPAAVIAPVEAKPAKVTKKPRKPPKQPKPIGIVEKPADKPVETPREVPPPPSPIKDPPKKPVPCAPNDKACGL